MSCDMLCLVNLASKSLDDTKNLSDSIEATTTTIKISNVGEDVTEEALRELCSKFGQVQRAFLAKVR